MRLRVQSVGELLGPQLPLNAVAAFVADQANDESAVLRMLAAQNVHVDDHAIWIDPNDPERWAIVNDGGIAITMDRGGNFVQGQNIPVPQYYEVSYDFQVPYNICGGAQDNGAWCGPSKRKGGVNNSYWFNATSVYCMGRNKMKTQNSAR